MTATRGELNALLAAILTTLAEVDFAPESALYMACGSDMDKWLQVRTVLTAANLATISRGNAVTITAAGRELAAKCAEAMAIKF